MQNIIQHPPEIQRRGQKTLGTVWRVAEARLPTEFGDSRIIGYRSLTSHEEFVALVTGIPRPNRANLVRIHSQCMTGDAFGSTRCDCGRQLHEAMRLIAEEGNGAIIYQQQEGRGIGIINKIRAYALQDEGADTVEANEKLGLDVDSRSYEQCAEILRDLGFWKVRALTNNPAKVRALQQCGLEIVERVALEVQSEEAAMRYLRTKKEKMGHLMMRGKNRMNCKEFPVASTFDSAYRPMEAVSIGETRILCHASATIDQALRRNKSRRNSGTLWQQVKQE